MQVRPTGQEASQKTIGSGGKQTANMQQPAPAQTQATGRTTQPPEVERMKSSGKAMALRAPETGKGTVVDTMG